MQAFPENFGNEALRIAQAANIRNQKILKDTCDLRKVVHDMIMVEASQGSDAVYFHPHQLEQYLPEARKVVSAELVKAFPGRVYVLGPIDHDIIAYIAVDTDGSNGVDFVIFLSHSHVPAMSICVPDDDC